MPATREQLEKVLLEFVYDIEFTGGVIGRGLSNCPCANPTWTDLGDTYVKACVVLGRKPMTVEEDDKEEDDE